LPDVVANPFLLVARLLAGGGNLLLEVVIGGSENAGQVGDPRPDVVLSLVPVALGVIKGLVVSVLRLEDALLEADVTCDLVS
jgi:hypothetical protein